MDLKREIILALIQSDEAFPVDFNSAWKWVGYISREKAQIALEQSFDLSIDFIKLENQLDPFDESSHSSHAQDIIYLTVDCFKSFAVMAGTEKGKIVRRYFLDCEKELEQRVSEEKIIRKNQIIQDYVSDRPSRWKKRYEDEFFDNVYRVTGWEKPIKGHRPCMGKFINETIYKRFPPGVLDRLEQVNTKRSTGGRHSKHHQHLTDFPGLTHLGYQLAVVTTVLRLSPSGNPKRFRQNMEKACSKVVQFELPFQDDLDQAS